jgi:hypothetical protein
MHGPGRVWTIHHLAWENDCDIFFCIMCCPSKVSGGSKTVARCLYRTPWTPIQNNGDERRKMALHSSFSGLSPYLLLLKPILFGIENVPTIFPVNLSDHCLEVTQARRCLVKGTIAPRETTPQGRIRTFCNSFSTTEVTGFHWKVGEFQN